VYALWFTKQTSDFAVNFVIRYSEQKEVQNWHKMSVWWFGELVNALVSLKVVALRRVRLLLEWVTV